MATNIPSREELYYDESKNVFRAKNKTLKWVKIGMMVGLFLGFMFQPQLVCHNVSKSAALSAPSEEVALINYVSKFSKEGYNIAVSSIKWATEFEIDPMLVLAIQKVESRFDKFAISSAGAMGLMQVIPSWHIDKIKYTKKMVGSPELFSIEANIVTGIQVLKDCQVKHRVVSESLKCYNGSVGMKTNYDARVMREYEDIKRYVKESV